MRFYISACTDVGLSKETNQDSLVVLRLNTPQGQMVFAALCDGMGGLAKGEVASASVIQAFRKWALQELPKLCMQPLEDSVLRRQWKEIIDGQNDAIRKYGLRQGVRLGTTAVVLLLTQNRYYVLNIGDSRVYELSDGLRRITRDHTLVAQEVARGILTEYDSERDSRRNILTQCVGVGEAAPFDMFFGQIKSNMAFILCSDGFRHEVAELEIYEKFRPDVLTDEATMEQNIRSLIELNKRRQEMDNISVVLVKAI